MIKRFNIKNSRNPKHLFRIKMEKVIYEKNTDIFNIIKSRKEYKFIDDSFISKFFFCDIDAFSCVEHMEKEKFKHLLKYKTKNPEIFLENCVTQHTNVFQYKYNCIIVYLFFEYFKKTKKNFEVCNNFLTSNEYNEYIIILLNNPFTGSKLKKIFEQIGVEININLFDYDFNQSIYNKKFS